MKIVINSIYGGFSLSTAAKKLYLAKKGLKDKIPEDYLYDVDIPRDDHDLVATVEELSSDIASGTNANLKIVEIPDGVEWQVEEYDGFEWISEVHRTWR